MTFNAKSDALKAAFFAPLVDGDFCKNEDINRLSPAKQSDALNAVSIINDNVEIEHSSLTQCRMAATLTAEKARNAALRVFVGLFTSKTPLRPESESQNRDMVDDLIDSSRLPKTLKIFGKYANMASDPQTAADLQDWYHDFQEDKSFAVINTIMKAGPENLKSDFELMNRFTPGFNGDTNQDKQVFDLLTEKAPRVITHMILDNF